MWKIYDEKVTVYKKPDTDSPQIIELNQGDVVDLVTKFFKGVQERKGISWVNVWLSDGRKGYILENTEMEDIGDGEENARLRYMKNSLL